MWSVELWDSGDSGDELGEGSVKVESRVDTVDVGDESVESLRRVAEEPLRTSAAGAFRLRLAAASARVCAPDIDSEAALLAGVIDAWLL